MGVSMGRALAFSVTAICCLSWLAPLGAHHSIGMFEIDVPVWVKGTVARYEPVNPHAIIVLDEDLAGGGTRRWLIDGPSLRRLGQLELEAAFLKVGDVIEVCAFAMKDEFASRSRMANEDSTPRPFVSGHVLILPDGRRVFWSPYGRLDNCYNPENRPPIIGIG